MISFKQLNGKSLNLDMVGQATIGAFLFDTELIAVCPINPKEIENPDTFTPVTVKELFQNLENIDEDRFDDWKSGDPTNWDDWQVVLKNISEKRQYLIQLFCANAWNAIELSSKGIINIIPRK